MGLSAFGVTLIAPNFLAVMFFVPFALLGVACITGGIFAYMRGAARPPKPATMRRLWKQLASWQVPDDAADAPGVVEELYRGLVRVMSCLVIGLGAGALVAAVLLSATATLWLDAPVGAALLGVGGFPAVLYLCGLVGTDVGLAIGIWRVRRVAPRTVTYADLHRRTLADYRVATMRWVYLLLVASVLTPTGLFTPHLNGPLQLDIPFTPPVMVTMTPSLFAALPVGVLMVLALGETLMGLVVRRARLLITSDVAVARRADDMLRARAIGMLQSSTLLAAGYLGMAQLSLLINGAWAVGLWKLTSPPTRPYEAVYNMAFLFVVLVQLLGFMLLGGQGRLGGRVTGWPWKPARAAA